MHKFGQIFVAVPKQKLLLGLLPPPSFIFFLCQLPPKTQTQHHALQQRLQRSHCNALCTQQKIIMHRFRWLRARTPTEFLVSWQWDEDDVKVAVDIFCRFFYSTCFTALPLLHPKLNKKSPLPLLPHCPSHFFACICCFCSDGVFLFEVFFKDSFVQRPEKRKHHLPKWSLMSKVLNFVFFWTPAH